VLDQRLVQQIAGALATNEGLVEKDWHIVRALAVIAAVDHGDAAPAFSSGTSLSKGWGLIKRFSEDIDFKVAMPAAASRAKARQQRSAYRERLLDALTAGGFTQAGAPLVGDASRFFSVDLTYPSVFSVGPGLRPHIRVEMSFHAPALPPIARPIQSLIATAQRHPPEVPAFPCIEKRGQIYFFTPAAECMYKSCSGSSHVTACTVEVECMLDGVVMLSDIP